MGGDLGPDDVRPVGDDVGRGKALPGEGLAKAAVDEIGQRPRIGAGRLVHRAALCHVGRMRVAGGGRRRKESASALDGETRNVPLAPPPPARGRSPSAAKRVGVNALAITDPSPALRADPPLSGEGGASGVAERQPDAAALLAWYDRHRRVLPWRAAPGETPDPYRVWLSEIMLQQTTVKAVGPYYVRFLKRFPTVERLAAAPLDDVLKAWAGLGYYARGRNRHAGGRAMVAQDGGKFPDTEEGLQKLPGIGPYTAAAIAAIAFDRPAVAVDGNVERVIARLCAIDEPLSAAKPRIREVAARMTPSRRPGDFAQAMMDLGATICTPKQPACILCPWNEACAALRHGAPETFPRKAPKAERPLRRGAAFVAVRADGFLLVRTRPEKGLLGGMTEVPPPPGTKIFAIPMKRSMTRRAWRHGATESTRQSGAACPAWSPTRSRISRLS